MINNGPHKNAALCSLSLGITVFLNAVFHTIAFNEVETVKKNPN